MTPNIGHPVDIGARYVVGIALLSLVFLIDSPWRWLGLLGIGPIVTALIGWCPGWVLLGINTARRSQR